MIFTCLLSAFLASVSPLNLVPANSWTTTGPPGAPGPINQVAVDPVSGTVYAVVEVRGSGEIFETSDSGRVWTALSPQPGSSSVLGLAANRRQTGHLLAANGSGVARSVDGGRSWNQVFNTGYLNPVVKILFDPSRENVAYGVGPFQLVRTLDDGSSWVLAGLSVPSEDSIESLAVAADGRLFVALNSTLVMSTDQGVTWSPGVFPWKAGTVFSFVADPVSPEVIYALTSGGLFRSADRAGSWSQLGTGVPNILAIDPGAPATLYAGNESGIWKSTDRGTSWRMLSTLLPSDAQVVSLVTGAASTLWAGTLSDGLVQSPNGGASWTRISGGLPGPPVTAIAVNSMQPQVVYAGAQGDNVARLYRSDDFGREWTHNLTELRNLPPLPPSITGIDPVSSDTVYAVARFCHLYCSGEILKTVDAGVSWAQLSLGGVGSVLTLSVDPENTQTLYATYANGVYTAGTKSIDGGSTWNDLPSFPNRVVRAVSQLLVDPFLPTTVYAALCDTGIFASPDGGATWTPRNQGLTDLCVLSLAQDAGTPGTLYAGTQTGIFKSVDRAMTWVPTGFTKDATALVVDPTNSNVIFVGTSQAGVFRSLDGGDTWTSFNQGLLSLQINALAIDSAGEFLHAATSAGVFDLKLNRSRVVSFR